MTVKTLLSLADMYKFQPSAHRVNTLICSLLVIFYTAGALTPGWAQNTPSALPSSLLVFPPGITLQTASNGELSTAVKASLFQNPEKAKEVVSYTVAELAKGGRLVPQKMPANIRGAKVTKVLAKKGQRVTTGQTLAIMDVQGKPMKYTATADGVIESLSMSPDASPYGPEPLALIAQSSEYSLTAIRHVILAAAIAAPGSITEIVSAAATAAPTVSGVIAKAAQEALPDQADRIAKAVPSPVATPTPDPASTLTPPELEMKQELEALKATGKLNDPKEVSAATKRVMEKNTLHCDIPAAMGATVIAIHKHPGDVVHGGDKILTLRMPDGRKIPVLAKKDGVVQELIVSKGGIIGNSRPASAKANSFHSIIPATLDEENMIRITMITVPLEN
jgi:biotin carboxyl carrier protein